MSKKILILAGDYVEDYEIIGPYVVLSTVGYEVDVVCPDKKKGDTITTAIHDFEGAQTYSEKRGHNFAITLDFDAVKVSEYVGLVIPGGRAPEYIRLNKRVLEIVQEFDKDKKAIAAICHGAQVLTAAKVLGKRKCTCYPACSPDLGDNYKEVAIDGVVVDENLISSPAWPGLSKWMKAMLDYLEAKITLK
ncbi:dj-1/thij/pfpi family protein [Anaeramoeba ignava]|uniref:Dj-1/thij/pfpi family protein n=1 Tax=Anaeramoeba ignava TaxID=1746090 RepID=A0A9Q0RAE0_ANAIG|nr:dj-1/thij/pfpi family protein [Anaeramoeba ignava]|eukprot:Anaeramoba_ignava/a89833_1332.p1 GENE.a89833_1332~~a89833_1332.p1  ORF type:complete len:209 (-),score=67.39 a89833_1332:53-625(-)